MRSRSEVGKKMVKLEHSHQLQIPHGDRDDSAIRVSTILQNFLILKFFKCFKVV